MKTCVSAILLSLAATGSVAADAPFTHQTVKARAQALAAEPYRERASRVPEWLQKINYDEYRNIRFAPDHAQWKGDANFHLQFFHPGFLYTKTVQIAEVKQGREKPIPFERQSFIYGQQLKLGEIPADMGFSGFRVHYPLNNPNYFDELIVFQGASYFRALGKGMRYGLSARGLALNTAQPGGEEFPVFEEFWIEKPAPKSKELVLHALLDTPTMTGAYQFQVKPGQETTIRVKATLFRRKGAQPGVLGVAPLTSMFWFGENSLDRAGDLRPEVHDSDGLSMERGNGEWIWRPLQNPNIVRTASFADENPKGFGLVQRDRQFAHYEDLEAAYHLRPSTWVEPIGAWGKGEVRLVEIPTPDETNDNIVAFWVPEKAPEEGQAVEFEYLLHWFIEGMGGKKNPGGVVVGTRTGTSRTHESDLQRFWVDFDGPLLRTLESDVEAVVEVGAGAKLVHQSVQKNTFNGTWRVAFSLRADAEKRPVELRCFLKKDAHYLSETWSNLWIP
ncbi:MAG: glucan biosynthesis protein G [Opitutaceae bacterium]|nr:glucan biosynthesis protein G [Opitutaceae bacterium]